MNSVRSMHGIGDGLAALWRGLTRGRGLSRGAAWGLMIVGALLAFEIFNFSTTEYALHDLLGDLTFASMRWSTVLAIAFCAMDFAGIARIFTPERGRDEPAEVWYLFGAWLLAAAFNAALTWWGVSAAIAQQSHSASAAAAVASPRSYAPSGARSPVPSAAVRSASPVPRPVSSFRPAPKPSPAS